MEDKEKKQQTNDYEKPELTREGELRDVTAQPSGFPVN